MKFPIGTKYSHPIAKNLSEICTVVDYLVTYNLASEIVGEKYVTCRYIAGIPVIETDVSEDMIARHLIPAQE